MDARGGRDREARRLLAVGAFCRAHYGGILTAAGRWAEAEAELSAAAKLFEGGSTAMEASALVRLADLRVRQGRLEEAAGLLKHVDQHHDAVRPLAALNLARGDAAMARDLLERTLPPDAGGSAAGPLLALRVLRDASVAPLLVSRQRPNLCSLRVPT